MKLLFTFLFSLVCAALQGHIDLKYLVTVKDAHTLRVQMDWQSEGRSESVITFTPYMYDGVRHTCHFGLTIDSGAHVAMYLHDSSEVRLHHSKGARVSVSYLVPNDMHFDARLASKPAVYPDYFHVLGYFLFGSLDQYEQQTATITWDLPRGWSVFNSYMQGQSIQKVKVVNPIWREAIFAGGKVNTYETHLKHGQVKSYFLDSKLERLRDSLENLVIDAFVNQRNFWHETIPVKESFVVVFLPIDSGQTSVHLAGMGVINAFSVFLQPDAVIDPKQLQHLIYHEMMHHWIGQRLRMQPNAMMPDERWFVEGFTEYFSYLVESVSGNLSESEFCQIAANQFFIPYYAQPARQLNRSNMAWRYLDHHSEDLYAYQAGFVYASFLDGQLRCKTGHKLHLGILIEQLMVKQEEHEQADLDDLLLHLLVGYLGKDVVTLHHDFTQRGIKVPLKDYPLCHPYWFITTDGGSDQIRLHMKE
jgi:predicted metalloprotease with PDZ domain